MRFLTFLTLVVCVTMVFSFNFSVFGHKEKETKVDQEEDKTIVKKVVSQIFDYFSKDKDSKEKEKEKAEKAKKDEISKHELAAKWYKAFKFGNMWDKLSAGYATSKKVFGSEVNLGSDKINSAIKKSKGGIEKLMIETKNITLDKFDFNTTIKKVETNETSKKDCAKALTKALPSLMSFGKHAATGHVFKATNNLFDTLKFLSDISINCLHRNLTMTNSRVDKVKCRSDLMELTKSVNQLARHPLHFIDDAKSLKTLVNYIPKTLGHCTTAFDEDEVNAEMNKTASNKSDSKKSSDKKSDKKKDSDL